MSYCPTWDEVLPTAKEVAKKEVWRTIYLSIDREDLQQEAYFVYHKCINGNYIYENEKHFFTFFRVSLKNRITDLIKNRRAEKEAVIQYSLENTQGESILENSIVSSETSDFDVKLKEAPQQIKDVITLLKKYPKELINLNRITNKRICDLLGYDHNKVNILEELRIYFRKGE